MDDLGLKSIQEVFLEGDENKEEVLRSKRGNI